MEYKISEKFTTTPGGRFRTDGKYSGEEFREDVLVGLIQQAREKKEKIIIDLDDTYGYPSSFLEESFGGLARKIGKDVVNNYIEIKSDDDPLQIDRIRDYIEHANDKK